MALSRLRPGFESRTVPKAKTQWAFRRVKKVRLRLRWLVKIHESYRRRLYRRHLESLEDTGIHPDDIPTQKESASHPPVDDSPSQNEMEDGYHNRVARPEGNSAPEPGNNTHSIKSVKFTTWNINHITSKRAEVELMMRRTGVDVLALQETGRNQNMWPLRLKGFNIIESLAVRSNGEGVGVLPCSLHQLPHSG